MTSPLVILSWCNGCERWWVHPGCKGSTSRRVQTGNRIRPRPNPCPVCGSQIECVMCHGSGVYPYTHPSGVRRWAECGLCLGTGLEHDDDAHVAAPRPEVTA